MYERKNLRLLGGSLDLRFDLSETPEQHSLEAQNIRVDRLGHVLSRKGAPAVNTGTPTSNVDLHTLAQRPGSSGLYLGAGPQLYRNNGSQLLSSSFDGQPLGAVAQNGWLWVMNQALQGKDNGGTFYNWLAAAPASAPTVTPGATDTATITNFHNTESADFSVTDNDGGDIYPGTPDAGKYPNAGSDPPVHFDSATKVNASTDSLRLRPTYAGTYEVTKTFSSPADLSVDSQERDSDIFRLHLLPLDPDAIASVSIAVDVNAGDFTTDYYTCEIPRVRWGNSRKVWVQLDLLRGAASTEEILRNDYEYATLRADLDTLRQQIDNGTLDPADADYQIRYLEDALEQARTRVLSYAAGFRRTGSTSGKSWATAKAVRITLRITQPTYVWLDEMTIFGGVGGSFEGEVLYRVTFDTAASHETNPGPASTSVAVSRQGVALSNIPTSADAQVTKRHIYRGGQTLGGSFYRVHTLNDNVTTIWTDTVSDDQATDGVRLRDDRDPPPAALGLAGPYYNRLVAFNTSAFPNRFWWTRVNLPQYWPPTSYNDVGDRNSGILAVTQHGRILTFYKNGSIHILAGDPEDGGILEEADSTVGILGPKAVANAGDVDYFAGPDGIYEFNLRAPRKIMLPVEPIFQGEAVTIGPGVTVLPISSDATARSRTVVVFAAGLLRIQYAESGQSYPSVELIYNVTTGQIAQNRYNLTNGGFRSMLYDANENKLYGGQRSGYYHRVGDQTTDNGSVIQVKWQSKYEDLGEPDRDKVFEDLVLEHNTGSDNIAVKAYLNDGASQVSIATINSSAREREVIPLNSGAGLAARNIALRIEGDSDGGLGIYDATLHYYLKPRRARSFDTGLIDLGVRSHKQLLAIEVDIETEDTNVLNYQVFSDMPGAQVASRESSSKAISGTGRQNPLYILPAATITGGLFRLVLTRTTEFYLWGLRLKVMPYPAHVNGDTGEIWETQVLTL